MIVAALLLTYINQRPGRGGMIHVDDGTRTAVVSVSPGPGPTDISVSNAKRVRVGYGDHAPLRAFNRAPTVGSRGFSSVDRVLSKREDREETLIRNGFTIVSETKSQSTSYALEARSADRMHQIYLDILNARRTPAFD